MWETLKKANKKYLFLAVLMVFPWDASVWMVGTAFWSFTLHLENQHYLTGFYAVDLFLGICSLTVSTFVIVFLVDLALRSRVSLG